VTEAELKAQLAHREDLLARVRKVLIENLNVPRAPHEIDPDTPLFGTGLALDSVDGVELAVGLEAEFGVQLPEDHSSRRWLRSVNTLVELVLTLQGKAAAKEPQLAREESAGDVQAIRTGTALHAGTRYAWLRIGGEGAFALLDRVSTQALRLQHAQLKQSLFLAEDGAVRADVLIARDESEYLVGIDGLTPAEAVAYLDAHKPQKPVTITDLSPTRASITLTGPWAWELLGDALSADLVGMPYLSFFRVGAPGQGGSVIVVRAGTTGEFGYEILMDKARQPELMDRLLSAGRRLEVAQVSAEALELCSLENGFFDIRREGAHGLTPLELQLQWRLSSGRDFVGARALAERRARGVSQRLTHFTSAKTMSPGAPVDSAGQTIGKVLASAHSTVRGDAVGVALLDLPWAQAGVDVYRVKDTPIRTVAPPHLDNRSLYVSPLHHSWAARASEVFPALT
jgi:acyl carrier protein